MLLYTTYNFLPRLEGVVSLPISTVVFFGRSFRRIGRVRGLSVKKTIKEIR